MFLVDFDEVRGQKSSFISAELLIWAVLTIYTIKTNLVGIIDHLCLSMSPFKKSDFFLNCLFYFHSNWTKKQLQAHVLSKSVSLIIDILTVIIIQVFSSINQY